MFGNVETWLPTLNALLILISGVFLVIGYVGIRRKRVLWHKRSMLTASVFAVLFLVVYLTRAALLPTKFYPGEGLIRTVYLAILVSHTIVAVLVAPFAFVTLRRALRGNFGQHRAIARITLPMWLYTVVTGWVVYMMLYW
jgi:putative membrane protein